MNEWKKKKKKKKKKNKETKGNNLIYWIFFLTDCTDWLLKKGISKSSVIDYFIY